MPVQSERDARIAVAQLGLNNGYRCSVVDQLTGHGMTEGVEPATRYTQLGKQRVQLLFPKLVCRIGTITAMGKQVSVLVELKARFDEESNIEWARTLKEILPPAWESFH